MPYKYPTKKRFMGKSQSYWKTVTRRLNRRTYRKRKHHIPNTVKSNTIANLIPNKRFTTMIYQGSAPFTQAALTNNFAKLMRLNSIYAPANAWGGKNYSADGWTVASNQYVFYKVHSVDVEVRFCNVSNYSGLVGIACANTTTYPLGSTLYASDVLQRQGGISRVIGVQNGGHDVVTIRKKYLIADVIGVTRQQYNDDVTYQSAINASPSPQGSAYMAIIVSSHPDLSQNPISVNVDVRMRFHVELMDPIEQQTDQ